MAEIKSILLIKATEDSDLFFIRGQIYAQHPSESELAIICVAWNNKKGSGYAVISIDGYTDLKDGNQVRPVLKSFPDLLIDNQSAQIHKFPLNTKLFEHIFVNIAVPNK